MSLSRRERRVFRAIVDALAADDPVLADLLSAPVTSEVVIVRMAWAFIGASMLLLIWGLLVNDSDMVTGAVLTLASTPVVLFVVAKALAHDTATPGRGGDDDGPVAGQ
jgi:hypothetical protein